MKKKSQEQFINEVNIKHNNKYDYSKTVYTKSRDKITITCPEHGDFCQIANKHLQGQGCPICGQLTKANKRKYTQDYVISEFKKVHGDTYDYSNVIYQKAHDPVEIICKNMEFFIRLL